MIYTFVDFLAGNLYAATPVFVLQFLLFLLFVQHAQAQLYL